MCAGSRVLLVDDEEKFLLNLSRLLQFRGFDVVTAADGYSALAILDRDGRFDVAILDIKMPGMDGIATLRAVKKKAPGIEVIMLTGHATIDSGIQAIREGAFDYLMKPCDIEDLTEKIKDACQVEHIRHHPVLWRRSLVKEISRPFFVKLYVDDAIEKAFYAFTDSSGPPNREELYILDRQDRFQGVVTRNDLIMVTQKHCAGRPVSWSRLLRNPGLLPEDKLGSIMRTEHPVATAPEENLTRVAQRMIAENVRCMPVVAEGRVIGFIRLQDIFYHVEQAIA